MCNEQGGTIDDLYCYRLADEEYLLIVNASRASADFGWLEGRARAFPQNADLTLKDVSDVTGAVAVQGPRVAEFIDECFTGPAVGGTPVRAPSALKKNQIARFKTGAGEAWVSRTGYTGEDGFEVVAPSPQILGIWNRLLEAGTARGLKAAGLGARDTLRTGMCYPLYGHELSREISPIQAGLGFFVAFEKGEFVGRAALLEEKGRGPKRKLVAFKLTERGAPPRPQYAIFSSGNEPIGYVASGTQSPSLNVGIGLGYVSPEFARPETPLQVEVRGKRFPAVAVAKPIYRKP
jgi:aminomethyltransferase